MHKKNVHKKFNKNRQNKISNPPSSQIKTDVVPQDHKVENIPSEDKDTELKQAERVPQIVSEPIVPISTDTKETEGDAPKKPKRHRGKKKKHNKGDEIFEDNRQEKVPETTVQSIELEEDIKFIDDEVENKNVPEYTNVVPAERKKKNKNKNNVQDSVELPKTVDISQDTLDKSTTLVLDEDLKITQTPEVAAFEEPKQNKKNKKKKHRHDSEKSDKSAESSCIAAFQNLLDGKDEDENKKIVHDNTSEQVEQLFIDDFNRSDVLDKSAVTKVDQTESISEINLSEVIKNEQHHDTVEIADGKNKKHNKNDKKKSPKPKSLIDPDTYKSFEETSVSLASIECEKQILPKESRPTSLFETMTTTENVICDKPNEESSVEISCQISTSVTSLTVESIPKESQKAELASIQEPSHGTEDDLKIKGENTVVTKLDDIIEQKESVDKQNIESLNAPEKGTRKKRKMSPKPFSMKQDSNKDIKTGECMKENKPEEIHIKNSVEVRSARASESEGSTTLSPDFIEYPRSTSEQYLDSNNNTIIQDVSGVQEIKLEEIVIPDKVSIQISGETAITLPEVTANSMTGIITAQSEEREKTDLKSKVIEVNKDMEELRLSLEKSLAELTAIEKTEIEIEKQYEEKIEARSEDIKTETKIEHVEEAKPASIKTKGEDTNENVKESQQLEASVPILQSEPPTCPPRKDHKGKGKKKKGKQEESTASTSENSSSITVKQTKQEDKQEENSEQKSENTQEKGRQQSDNFEEIKDEDATIATKSLKPDYEQIDDFEDALSSSVDDVNKTFEMIANETNHAIESSLKTPEISIVELKEETDENKKQENKNPVSQPKNLLGHPDIPVPSSKTDYKKEKNKTPNTKQAKVKIKDAEEIETSKKTNKESKQSQTESKLKKSNCAITKETVSCVNNNDAEYVYKYSFRKVYLHSTCHVCKKELKNNRVSCSFCNLVFYCNQKHRDEDWTQHQALCFALSTIVHLKGQKHIYEDAKNASGYNYRLLRMQAIVSCEKILKRRLVPWEQEVLLYPRMCCEVGCREWRQSKLRDCEGCGQISYCVEHPDHLAKSHQRWCKSYSLYQKLVCYQQTKGRLEPKLPSRVITEEYQMPEKINEILASMYQEKIDMNDMQYAALTQLATAPLTAAYCHQIYINKINSVCANGVCKKSLFTLHVVGAELQFEADGLNKWEVFFLHLRPDVQILRVVLIGPELNPSNLPLDLLGNIKLCEYCRQKNRKVTFDFQDRKTYYDFRCNDNFSSPDLVCAFNPSIERSSYNNGKDIWPATITCVLKLKIPFLITSYTLTELNRDLARIKDCAGVDFSIISEPKHNPFASVRPDRNFISDDEMPLLFKNHCYTVICGNL